MCCVHPKRKMCKGCFTGIMSVCSHSPQGCFHCTGSTNPLGAGNGGVWAHADQILQVSPHHSTFFPTGCSVSGPAGVRSMFLLAAKASELHSSLLCQSSSSIDRVDCAFTPLCTVEGAQKSAEQDYVTIF